MGEKRNIPITPVNGSEAEEARLQDIESETVEPEAGGAEPGLEAEDVVSAAGAPSVVEGDTEAEGEAELLELEAEEGPATIEAADYEAVAAERDAYWDGLVRLKADFDNFRKRSQRELAEAAVRARADVLTEFLPILDNLDRALNAAEHHEEGKVLEGVRMTQTLFTQLLRREGVEGIDPLGEPFDPTLHEAMIAAPSSEEEGTVTAVMERGYLLNDQVLRPAKVAVSAGPAEAEG